MNAGHWRNNPDRVKLNNRTVDSDPNTGVGSGLASGLDSGLVAALAAYIFWGFGPLYWRLIETPASQIILWRFVQTAILTGGLIWVRSAMGGGRLRLPLIHLVAAFLIAANWFVYIYAIETERVVDASLGYFINPLVSVALGMLVLGERLSRSQQLAVALAVVGVIALAVDAGTLGSGRFPWIPLVLAFSFGCYGLVRKQSPLEAVEGLAADAIWLVVPAGGALVYLGVNERLVFGSGRSIAAFTLIGAVTAFPLMLFAFSARRMTLSTVGLLQYLTPAIQFFLGWLVFGESISGGRWIGVGFIWAALAVLGFGAGRRDTQVAGTRLANKNA